MPASVAPFTTETAGTFINCEGRAQARSAAWWLPGPDAPRLESAARAGRFAVDSRLRLRKHQAIRADLPQADEIRQLAFRTAQTPLEAPGRPSGANGLERIARSRSSWPIRWCGARRRCRRRATQSRRRLMNPATLSRLKLKNGAAVSVRQGGAKRCP